MPHQCTNCGETFDDGSKEMLSGCPDCGGHKFQFRPSTADGSDDADAPSADASSDDADARADRQWVDQRRDSSTSDPADPAPGSGDPADAGAEADRRERAESTETADSTGSESAGHEDRAQADARSGVVSSDELPDADTTGPDDVAERGSARSQHAPSSDDVNDVDSEASSDPPGSRNSSSSGDADASGDQPDLSDLREELNSQFESIRILGPGQYELNLMELYDREEYIISLREDGRYVIEVPETWRGGAE